MNKPKSYYYDWSVEKLKEIDKLDQKPTILLHACCAPCICWPLEFLYEHFEISVLYNNSNIWPQEEYDIRKNEIVSYIETFNKQHNTSIQITVTPYDYQSYREKLLPLKDEPECGARCHLCYKTRMEEAYQYANDHQFDYFCTIMTISRQKSSQVMNEIGEQLQNQFETKYFFSDFKKKNGLLRRNELVKEHRLYNQTYCGCEFSYHKK